MPRIKETKNSILVYKSLEPEEMRVENFQERKVTIEEIRDNHPRAHQVLDKTSQLRYAFTAYQVGLVYYSCYFFETVGRRLIA